MSDENKQDNQEQSVPVEEKKEEQTSAEAPAQEEEKKEEASTPAQEDAGENVETPDKFKTIVEAIEKMSVLDLHELVKFLEKKFGVSAQAVAVAPGAGAGDSAGAEEKTDFNVELTDAGAQKIAVIKVVKDALGLGLKEAKDLVDAAPAVLKEGMKKEEAEDLKKKVEEAGGKVELK